MENIVRNSYVLSLLSTLIGVAMKLGTSLPFSSGMLIIGIVLLIVFIVTAIMEVNRSTKISDSEKFMWSVGFVLFATILGFVYVFLYRKKII